MALPPAAAPAQSVAHDPNAGLPKLHTRGPPTPPPAYFPRITPGPLSGGFVINPFTSAARLAAARMAGGTFPGLQPTSSGNSGATTNSAYQNNRPHLASGWQDNDDHSSDDEDGECSAITVRISTAVRVLGDSNIVHASANDRAATACFVAEAVARVLRGVGAQERGGIPMIDEEGRPRPLRIEIEAGTEVCGKSNVLGSEEVVLGALGKRRREVVEVEEGKQEGMGRVLKVRRRRSASV